MNFIRSSKRHESTRPLRTIPRPAWVLPLLLALVGCKDAVGPQQNAVRCNPDGTVIVDGNPALAAPGGYVTVGNRIISSATCKPYRFIGIANPGFAFSPEG